MAHYRQMHPDVLILQHYIGATPYSADWAAMLRRLMGEFKRRFHIQQDIPDKPDVLRSAFANWLHMAAAQMGKDQSQGQSWLRRLLGKTPEKPSCKYDRIVLVLDALNQLEDHDGAPDLVWLPPVMADNLRLIVSTLPGRPLDEIRKRSWPTLEVEPLSQHERERLIAEYLAQSAKALSPDRVKRIAAAPQSANPLYLRVLLDELRLFGEHERLDERINHYLQAESPRDLYRKVIARWQGDYAKGTSVVGNTLGLLWAARRGLSETERLYALSRDGRPLARAVWSPLFLAMSDALVSRGGLLTFAHDFLRMATQDVYLPTERHQQQAHLRLADYFERQPSSPRRTDELPWQLGEAHAWEALQALLTDRDFFTDAWNRNQFEVQTYWAQIEAGSSLRMVQAYCTLIERPEQEEDKNHLLHLSLLLGTTGHPEESLGLSSALVDHFLSAGDSNGLQATLGNQADILRARGDLDGAMALLKKQEHICHRLGNLDGLSTSLGNQANILRAWGDLDGAMPLHKEQERLCRQLGNLDGLSNSLGNQANVLYDRGDLDGAMALLKEDERTCRQLGNPENLAISLINQASTLNAMGLPREGLPPAEEAHKIATSHGYTALAETIEPILSKVRQAARGS